MIFEVKDTCGQFDRMQETKFQESQRPNRTLNGQRIVLIGGTSGFGFATARAAASEGAAIIVASSSKTKVDQAVARLPAGVEGHVLDITREASVEAFFSKIGEFDHLAVTAGESLNLGVFATIKLEDARRFFETRFWGSLTVAKHASKQIKAAGSIILTNGVIGLRPQKGWVVAAGICGALEALTRALAVELAPIRVNLVCAGFVRTELWGNMPESERNALFEKVGQMLPAGRVGEADDLAETYLYLMRERFSTGAMIVVDGGGVLV
jgi:NAD(P)-dependent dehydrogenase (short-subunit alcohol dehydrogenase family)